MLFDLSRLTPAPWKVRETDTSWLHGPNGHPLLLAENDDDEGRTAITFAALARNAFDVMMQRGWTVLRLGNGQWGVPDIENPQRSTWNVGPFDDPFTALTEADKWYREHRE